MVGGIGDHTFIQSSCLQSHVVQRDCQHPQNMSINVMKISIIFTSYECWSRNGHNNPKVIIYCNTFILPILLDNYKFSNSVYNWRIEFYNWEISSHIYLGNGFLILSFAIFMFRDAMNQLWRIYVSVYASSSINELKFFFIPKVISQISAHISRITYRHSIKSEKIWSISMPWDMKYTLYCTIHKKYLTIEVNNSSRL